MFTRAIAAPFNVPSSPARATPVSADAVSSGTKNGMSLIGRDIKISGTDIKIESNGTLQIDGEIEGQVLGKEIIIGELGRITGAIQGERLVIRGRVSGTLRCSAVFLEASSVVEGDIHSESLSIEAGAKLDGKCRPTTKGAGFMKQPVEGSGS